jgi:FAD/FMN-containing dehydrogenase
VQQVPTSIEAALRRTFGPKLLGAPGEQALRSSNPFALQEDPAAFQTRGWLGAFESVASRWTVMAEDASDVAAAVSVARSNGVPVVVKNTGHDYLGRSCARDALMIWTHRMRDVQIHDAFVPAGSDAPGLPAITLGAGTRWIEAYQALAAVGRYVQGGGCTSVGVAGGFTLGGGFGSLSRKYGTSAGNVLEVEVVTASGEIVVANEVQRPELFWALRGGGGGTFGVVTQMTLRTHEPPRMLGRLTGRFRARNPTAFRELARRLVEMLPEACNDVWGEQIRLAPDNQLELELVAADATEQEMLDFWKPLAAGADADAVQASVFPFRLLWDPDALDAVAEGVVRRNCQGDPQDSLFWWAANDDEVGHYIYAYESRWLPMKAVLGSRDELTDALVTAAGHWPVALHLNKALCGASSVAGARDRLTSINPVAFDAAALVIAGAAQPGSAAGPVDSHWAAECAARVKQAMEPIRALTPDSGSYVNEADFFEPDWQRSFWGSNYPSLLEIKRKYDPQNLFRVHHGVGSEDSLR